VEKFCILRHKVSLLGTPLREVCPMLRNTLRAVARPSTKTQTRRDEKGTISTQAQGKCAYLARVKKQLAKLFGVGA